MNLGNYYLINIVSLLTLLNKSRSIPSTPFQDVCRLFVIPKTRVKIFLLPITWSFTSVVYTE
ncbi:hypothetical protein [Staphylococcus phage vB_SauM-V1SA19]|nr:hypothetical protein [Staphylococcus phage vB_SauM-V1SA19]